MIGVRRTRRIAHVPEGARRLCHIHEPAGPAVVRFRDEVVMRPGPDCWRIDADLLLVARLQEAWARQHSMHLLHHRAEQSQRINQVSDGL